MAKNIQKITSYAIKNNTLVEKDYVIPSIVEDVELFQNLVSAEALRRFLVKTVHLEFTSRKKLEKCRKWLSENKLMSDTEEYEYVEDDAMDAEDDITAAIDLRKNINDTIEANGYNSLEVPDDMKEILKLYMIFISDLAYVSEGGKLMKYVVQDAQALYERCCEYSDKYTSTADIWTDERKKDFNEVRDALNKLGSRLNGDASNNRKRFSYKSSSKNVAELIAYATRYNKSIDKRTRNSFTSFQGVALATVFRIDQESVNVSNNIYI